MCKLEGSDPVLEELEKCLGIELGQTTDNMLFTLELTECLGRCAESPSVMINKDLYGNVQPDQIGSILEKYK